MIPVQKRIRPYLEVFEELGVEVVDLNMTGSCHYKITVTSGGKSRFFIAPYSPSDRRAFMNWKSQVRRWHKESQLESTA